MITRITLLKDRIKISLKRRCAFTKSILKVIFNISFKLQSSIISFFLIFNRIDNFLLNNFRNRLNINFASLIHKDLLFTISKSRLINDSINIRGFLFNSFCDNTIGSGSNDRLNSFIHSRKKIQSLRIISMIFHSSLQHSFTMKRFHDSIDIRSIFLSICIDIFSCERESLHESLSDNSS